MEGLQGNVVHRAAMSDQALGVLAKDVIDFCDKRRGIVAAGPPSYGDAHDQDIDREATRSSARQVHLARAMGEGMSETQASASTVLWHTAALLFVIVFWGGIVFGVRTLGRSYGWWH